MKAFSDEEVKNWVERFKAITENRATIFSFTTGVTVTRGFSDFSIREPDKEVDLSVKGPPLYSKRDLVQSLDSIYGLSHLS